jgi:2-dehydropantoate 2-reductase
MRLTIIGAGAVGGVIGARMALAGHDVLLCDRDAEHVDAINRHGLQLDGPVDRLTVRVPAVSPEGLPDRIDHAAIAVRSQDTAAAAASLGDRLAKDGWVVSLQRGMTDVAIADAVGRSRVLTGVVELEAEVTAPGRISQVTPATVRIGEPDLATVTPRVAAAAEALPGAQPTDTILGYLWTDAARQAILATSAVSDQGIAAHLRDSRYRPLMLAVAREVLAQAPCEPLALGGWEPCNLEDSLDRLATLAERSAESHGSIYRDLAVRGRTTEAGTMLASLNGPITRWVSDVIASIRRGERTCAIANLDLLVALERADRLGRALDAVVHLFAAPARAASGPLHGVPVAVKDLLAVRGTPTGNGNPTAMAGPPADQDAEVVARLRAAGADVFATTALLEYAAGCLHPDVPETRNPWNADRTASGSSGGSGALVGCGSCVLAIGTDTGGSIRLPAHFCGTVGFKPTHDALPTTGVTMLAPSLDHVGLLAGDVAWTARGWTALTGQLVPHAGAPLRLGVLTTQMQDPSLQPEMAATLRAALSRLREVGKLVNVDDAPFRAIDAIFGDIFAWEAWQELRPLLGDGPERLGPATVDLLRELSTVSLAQYRCASAMRDKLAARCADTYTGVDLLLGPAVPYVAPEHTPSMGSDEALAAALFTRPYNVTGAPAIVLPCGWSEGLPVGLQLSAPVGQDSALLAAAAVVEAALAFTRPATTRVEWPAPASGWTR